MLWFWRIQSSQVSRIELISIVTVNLACDVCTGNKMFFSAIRD